MKKLATIEHSSISLRNFGAPSLGLEMSIQTRDRVPTRESPLGRVQRLKDPFSQVSLALAGLMQPAVSGGLYTSATIRGPSTTFPMMRPLVLRATSASCFFGTIRTIPIPMLKT